MVDVLDDPVREWQSVGVGAVHYDPAVDWGTVGGIVLGAAVSLVSTLVVRRWEWRREQRVRIHLNELPAVRKEIGRLQIGADDPIVDPAELASMTVHALYTVASITSESDRKHAAGIVEAGDQVKAVGDRYDWHGTPQPTIEDRRVHGAEQQSAVERLNERTIAYENWLGGRLRFGR